MSIFVGNNEITGTDNVKLGGADIVEVYVGATKVWPTITPGDIEIELLPTYTEFRIETSDDFTTTHGGVTTPHSAGDTTISGITAGGVVTISIPVTTPASFFKFHGDSFLRIDINGIGLIETLDHSFAGLRSMTTFNCSADLSGVTNFRNVWFQCRGLTSFPLIDTSAGTNFIEAWKGCSGLTAFPLIDTSAGTDFTETWQQCTSLTSFPLIDVSSGTNFHSTWRVCSGLISFPALNVSNGTNFRSTWDSCSAITKFPALDFSSGTIFRETWYDCTGVTCFTELNFTGLTDGSGTFHNCSSLVAPAPTGTPVRATNDGTAGNWTNPDACITHNPEIEIKLVPGGTYFGYYSNTPITVEQDGTTTTYPAAIFPTGYVMGLNDASFIKIILTNDLPTTTFRFGDGEILHAKLNSVGKMTSLFSLFNTQRTLTTFECAAYTSKVTNFTTTWYNCEKLTSFPAIDTSSGTNFSRTWYNCSALTAFPLIDTSSGTNFTNTWNNCSALTAFPLIDTSSGTNFDSTWHNCSALTAFPTIDTSAGTDFDDTWMGCTNLVCIAGTLDFRKLTGGTNAFRSCPALIAPAPYGTPVRSGNNALAGIWTNPNPCP